MSTVPVADRTSVAHAVWAPLGAGALAVVAAAALNARDPHDAGSYGSCPFLALTGLPCPGCGGLRAVEGLTRGDLVAALSSNALVVVMVVAATAVWVVWLVRRTSVIFSRGGRPALRASIGARGALMVVPLIVLFGIVRVTPWGSWLAP